MTQLFCHWCDCISCALLHQLLFHNFHLPNSNKLNPIVCYERIMKRSLTLLPLVCVRLGWKNMKQRLVTPQKIQLLLRWAVVWNTRHYCASFVTESCYCLNYNFTYWSWTSIFYLVNNCLKLVVLLLIILNMLNH